MKKRVLRLLRHTAAWLAAGLLLLWRLTCRYPKPTYDPRPPLRAAGKGYTMVILHAHQLAAVFANDEARMVAMVSRSADGDLLVPSLRVRRVGAVRGSSRKDGRDKGGRRALALLTDKVRAGWPGLIACDGPRGPRNVVRPGAAKVALDTGLPVVPAAVIPSRRWILSRTWDRFQIPKPLSTVRLCFSEPIIPEPGESLRQLTARIQQALCALEERVDPPEAARVPAATTLRSQPKGV